MKRWEEEAIRLKYNGKTYREIADVLSKLYQFKLSESTIKHLFMITGRLYLPYLNYETKENQWSELHSRQEHKRLSAATANVRQQLLKEALKAKDFRLALDIVKDIDDRAGNVVVKKTINKEEPKGAQTYDDYLTECQRLGVDPKTGFPTSIEKMAKN
jgi:hypothetical protein